MHNLVSCEFLSPALFQAKKFVLRATCILCSRGFNIHIICSRVLIVFIMKFTSFFETLPVSNSFQNELVRAVRTWNSPCVVVTSLYANHFALAARGIYITLTCICHQNRNTYLFTFAEKSSNTRSERKSANIVSNLIGYLLRSAVNVAIIRFIKNIFIIHQHLFIHFLQLICLRLRFPWAAGSKRICVKSVWEKQIYWKLLGNNSVIR